MRGGTEEDSGGTGEGEPWEPREEGNSQLCQLLPTGDIE